MKLPDVATLYGDDSTRARAAVWAARHGLTLSQRSARCAHGLLGRQHDDPARCSPDPYVLLDHARVWNRDGRPALLLAHSYAQREDIEELAPVYAKEFGLVVTIGDPDDDWYGAAAVPIRYESVRAAS